MSLLQEGRGELCLEGEGVFLLICGSGLFDATRTRVKYQKTLLTQLECLGYRLELSKLLK